MIHQATPEFITKAATLIKDGQLVAFPTETVYGLGADATNAQAVASIYALKMRPSFNPLICHVADLNAAEKLALFDARARSLAQIFWPGPLTMVLPHKNTSPVADICTADLPTIAVRVPSHPVARALLEKAGVPIVAPSANLSGTVSPTSAIHVAESFGADAPFILAGGISPVGLESTIIDLSDPDQPPILLRPGSITREDIEAVIGPVRLALKDTPITSPGQLARHYATATPLRLNAVDVKPGEALLAFGSLKFMAAEGVGFAKDLPHTLLRNLSPEGDLTIAAANLFAMLRDLDKSGATGIAVMPIPNEAIGIAINDRLRRAATAA
jgi:L-threonylcarbamoyladenylate synthase